MSLKQEERDIVKIRPLPSSLNPLPSSLLHLPSFRVLFTLLTSEWCII